MKVYRAAYRLAAEAKAHDYGLVIDMPEDFAYRWTKMKAAAL
ncbi:MAG: hypothetical protein QXK12_03620 [Candidatus Nezhaarchaeales archaeon]